MQFYLQSSIVDKGISVKQYKTSRLDVIVGSFFTDIVGWFIIVVCAATLYTHGMRNITEAAQAADAMRPFAGEYAYILFAAGLFNASLFAASILPLSTAYTVCEGMGFESGLDKSFKEAPFFYWFYTLLIAAGASLVLIPNFPMVRMIVLSQVLNGVLLPVVLIFMLRLINKHELMGKHTNSTWFNWLAWGTAGIVIVLSLVMMGRSLMGQS
jgi:Mn2+/Fe2+ NRAMP family transporter